MKIIKSIEQQHITPDNIPSSGLVIYKDSNHKLWILCKLRVHWAFCLYHNGYINDNAHRCTSRLATINAAIACNKEVIWVESFQELHNYMTNN